MSPSSVAHVVNARREEQYLFQVVGLTRPWKRDRQVLREVAALNDVSKLRLQAYAECPPMDEVLEDLRQ